MVQSRKILVIDDSSFMRIQVKHILEKEDFVVMELGNVEDYFSSSWLYKEVDLILLDINLPGMDGIAALEIMSKDKSIEWPPVIILSGSGDRNVIQTAFLLGAKDYIVKPLSNGGLLEKVESTLKKPVVKNNSQKYWQLVQLVKDFCIFYKKADFKVFPIERITELLKECIQLVNCEEKMVLFDIETNVTDYIFCHSVNVAILSGLMGKWMGIKDQQLYDIVLAGLLHDIGKTQISPELLIKSGKLLPEELETLKTHSNHGYQLLQGQGFSEDVILGVGQHHERIDGSGYPNQLVGRDICLNAKIIAVADVYDAMTSNKIYRKATTPFVVMEEVFKEMFRTLDPHICGTFLRHIKECLVGKVIRLADGSIATVVYIEGDGFGEPILQAQNGEYVEVTENNTMIAFINM